MPASADKLKRARTTNSTASAWASIVPVETGPHDPANGIHRQGDVCAKFCKIVPFGENASNETFSMRFGGYNYVAADGIWVLQPLITLAVTLGNIAIPGLTTHFAADTIVVTDGDADAEVVTYGDDRPANVIVHARGTSTWWFDFNTGGSAAGANCYFLPMDQ